MSDYLFLLACSDHKAEGGSDFETLPGIFENSVDFESRLRLLGARKHVFDHIHSGGISRNGVMLNSLPYNQFLHKGPDFGGNSHEAKYLPAFQRYKGRLFRELNPGQWRQRKPDVLIVSGLYGLLSPESNIQLYSLHIVDSRNIYSLWNVELTSLLENYVVSKDIKVLVDMTAENHYRHLFDWDRLKSRCEVFHVLGSQHAGPPLLEAIGFFLGKEGLSSDDPVLSKIIKQDKKIATNYEMLHFVKNLAESRRLGLPVEEPSAFLSKQDLIVESKAQPTRLREISSFSQIDIVLSFRVLEEIEGLNNQVREKFFGTIENYIRKPNTPGLNVESVRVKGESVIRARIDQAHRIHFKPWDRERKNLVIRAVGGHRLEGID